MSPAPHRREPAKQPAAAVVPVVVVGARGRLGSFACELLRSREGFELLGGFDRGDDWVEEVRRRAPCVALEATRAGLGAEHGLLLLAAGARPVLGTSGITLEETEALDRRARELGLGGLVVPNFSLGSLLLQRACAEIALHFPAAEIVELHHEHKRDAPSGTAKETARRIAASRSRAHPPAGEGLSRGEAHEGVPIHSVRLPGLYAHQEVLFGSAGETLALRHDMHGPHAFGPGLLAALRYAWTATGVGRGIELAL